MNSVELIGRLTKDPEVKYSAGQNQTAVCRFTLAVQREGREGADFIRCVAFGKSAENLAKYKKKGAQIAILGRIQTGSYEDRDGRTVYTTDIIADRVEYIGGRADAAPAAAAPAEDFAAMDEDIPFLSSGGGQNYD